MVSKKVTYLSAFLSYFILFTHSSLAINIDAFEQSQSQSQSVVGTSASGIASLFSIGGTRNITTVKTDGLGIISASIDTNPGLGDEIIDLNQGTTTKGRVTVTWDGSSGNVSKDLPSAVNAQGLKPTGLNLNSDGSTQFKFKLVYTHGGSGQFIVKIRVFDANSSISGLYYSEAFLTFNSNTANYPDFNNFSIPFSSFTTGAFAVAPASFERIGAIQLILDGTDAPASDMSIAEFKTDGTCVHVPVNGVIKDDCGVCNGTNADKDDCGVCFGGNRDKDCSGACFGTSTTDQCGVCDANSSNDNDTCEDCAGIPNGTNTMDVCNVCDSNPSNNGDTCKDCLGIPNGTAIRDACGVCQGDNSTCSDCAGMPFGSKVKDVCGVCGGNGTSCLDCANTPFGNLKVDKCGVCGGTDACVDCAGKANGTSKVDRCNICGGDGTSCVKCETQDVSPLSFILDATAKDQEKAINRMLNDLVKVKPTRSNRTYRGKIAQIAHTWQVRNWNISWQIEQTNTQCIDSRVQGSSVTPTFCLKSAVNIEKVAEYRTHAKELRDLTYTVAKRLTKESKKLAPIAKRQTAQAETFYNKALSLADQIPTSAVSCN